jgi:ectoine hydroxylase-related dioxygenase (phytanoyl-CoA dioxygenase family)
MDWIVPVSESERANGALLSSTADVIRRALQTEGLALLRGAFPAAVIHGLHQEYLNQYGALNSRQMADRASDPPPNPFLDVGEARYEITPRMKGEFGNPEAFANPLLCRFLASLLGADMRLSGFTIVVSFPGAAVQHVHRDHPQLFGDLGPVLPAYAINVAVPLVDVSLETGPTGVWPGSHRWPDTPGTELPSAETATRTSFQRGDCVMLDYRTFHTGLANQSDRVRPIVYMAYARTWFFDETNHEGRTSLDMSLETYHSLPVSVRPLVLRAYSQAMRAQMLMSSERLR